MGVERLATGTVIDPILGGGFEARVVSSIQGAAGTGKTTLALLAARAAGTTAFLDTEGGLSLERVQQLRLNPKKLRVIRLTTFVEQVVAVGKLANLKDLNLVVLDSLPMLYRLELSDPTARKINAALARQLAVLSRLGHERQIPIIVTNQVYHRGGEVHPVAGSILDYWAKAIVHLEKRGRNREATLLKHRSRPVAKIRFRISGNGIEPAGLF